MAFILVGLSEVRPTHAVSLGEAKFEADCAVCHGVTGKGDGPLAESLKEGVPSLTTLKKNNGGVFPFERVYASIKADERPAAFDWLAEHPEALNVLGNRLNAEALAEFEQVYGYLPPGMHIYKTPTLNMRRK